MSKISKKNTFFNHEAKSLTQVSKIKIGMPNKAVQVGIKLNFLRHFDNRA